MVNRFETAATPQPPGNEIPFAYQVIANAAPRLGITLELEPWGREVARLEFPNGRIAYFRHGNLDINRSGSADLARDKHACAHFLAKAGIPVPASFPIRALHEVTDEPSQRLTDFVAQHSWPLVAKPNSRYGGQGVERVDNIAALRYAVEQALHMDKIVLVQPFVRGQDVRILVFDDAAIAAYRRIPPGLIGDGRQSVELLIEYFYAADHAGPAKRLTDRSEVTARLARREGGLQRVPRCGENIPLVDAANVATGAELVDLSQTLPPDVLSMAIDAVRTAGLRLAGVDLLVDAGSEHSGVDQAQTDRDVTHDGRRDRKCVVLEINSAPELDGFASLGENQLALVERLYESILLEIAG